ncbi:uncharacterized protein NPIL_144111 [Nephila pilipes]|uniref:Uncharacterized protein n=1 Tax=Nephila pilipes TaxID=299642 RepID=A0A8X6MPM3_NEPPI|nr:uncharacterized protein NPIL_144111 [Nephila pilipes]
MGQKALSLLLFDVIELDTEKPSSPDKEEKSKLEKKSQEVEEDEIMDESKIQIKDGRSFQQEEEFKPTDDSKSETEDTQSFFGYGLESKPRTSSDAVKMPEFPNISSKNIIVEKGKDRKSQKLMDQKGFEISNQDLLEEDVEGGKSRNLMGQKGFVSSLLFDVIETGHREPSPPDKEEKSKPVSEQDLLERRSTVMAVAADIQSHFSKKSPRKSTSLLQKKKSGRKSTSQVSGNRKSEFLHHWRNSPRVWPSSSIPKLLWILYQEVFGALAVSISSEPEISLPTKSETLPPDLSHLKSGWQPTAEADEEAPRIGFQRRKQSWVGSYVEGTDYWSKMESEEETKLVEFEMDLRSKTWYDIPVTNEVKIEIPLDSKRVMSRTKLESLKMKTSQDLLKYTEEEKRELFSFDHREPFSEKISNDLYQMFMEFCKSDDLSAVQNRISLLNADKCLEQVGLLDHKNLTLVHTGFCFKASGGSRFRGLTFAEFKIFIDMVAETLNMPIFDFVNKLKLGYAGIIIQDEDG